MSQPKVRPNESTDDVWEDVIPNGRQSSTRTGSMRSDSPSSQSPRRRRAVKTVFVAAGSSRRRRPGSRTPKKRRSPSIGTPDAVKSEPSPPCIPPVPPVPLSFKDLNPGISKQEVKQVVSTGIRHTLRYVLEIFITSIKLLRKPLSFILFLWLLAMILVRVNNTLRVAFAPVCYLPLISRSAFCASPSGLSNSNGKGRGGPPQWADYPHLMDVQSATFEQLLEDSVGGSGLALEIKKAEMATVDLATLVRVSNLKSRDMIAETLAEFVEDARKTGRGLQKLSAKVGGAVDGILAVNDYALHTIEGTLSAQPSRFALLPFASKSTPNELVTRTFTEAMDQLATSMARLIVEAQASIANLDALELRLSTLHELVSREDASLASAKSELLSELWTKLGGNRRTLRGYDEHLFLLRNLGDYRRRALVHVVAALQTLQAMSEDMQDMRERVAAPELMGSSIPVEVHIKSIRSGLERLKEGRIKAKEREEEAVRRILTLE